MVDHLTVSGGPRPLHAEVRGLGEEQTYYLNGRKAQERPFKAWYQAVIGLLSDAEYTPVSASAGTPGTDEIVIEYRLHTFPGDRVYITLIPHDRDFYALRQEGTTEFLISRNQVRRIWETADAVTFEE
jgi:hypothetical protein